MTDPSVEDATRRINVLIEGQVEGPEADIAARDLIVLMRELGRVTAENADLRRVLLPPLTQGEEETARILLKELHGMDYVTRWAAVAAALAAEPASGEADDKLDERVLCVSCGKPAVGRCVCAPPISHEPLRNDARNLLPVIDAALKDKP